MYTINSGQLDLLRAVFCEEFASDAPGGGLDRDAIAEIADGGIGDWILDLERTGLFSRAEVRSIADQWVDAPHSLVELLLDGVDEVAAKRERHVSAVSVALDRTAG